MMPSLTPRQREMFTRIFACRSLTVSELAKEMDLHPQVAAREVLFLERSTLIVSDLHRIRAPGERPRRLKRVVRPAPWTMA